MRWRLFLLTGIVLISVANIKAESLGPSSETKVGLLEPAHFPSLISTLKIDGPLEFCGEPVPLEVREIRERLDKEILLSLWYRPQVILWLKRSSRYMPIIEEMLKKNGLPDDLKFVAIAESALRPHARSKKGAVGFWQFIKYTGEKYGLVINARFDERRNIFDSTRAAIELFQDLHEQFGSWSLAAAAYNMGEEGLMAEILEQGNNDYYQLYLPLETQRYVFRILAVKMIFKDPEKYGFRLSEEDYYPPLNFDEVEVECTEETPIRIVAQAAKTHFKVIKDLNPEIRGHYLPKGNHKILIPGWVSEDFQVRYKNLLKRWSAGQRARTYVVRAGDSLTSIADRFGVPLASLLIWNRINPKAVIHPGDRLIIYREDSRSRETENDEDESDGNL
jgi:hypothetical protein